MFIACSLLRLKADLPCGRSLALGINMARRSSSEVPKKTVSCFCRFLSCDSAGAKVGNDATVARRVNDMSLRPSARKTRRKLHATAVFWSLAYSEMIRRTLGSFPTSSRTAWSCTLARNKYEASFLPAPPLRSKMQRSASSLFSLRSRSISKVNKAISRASFYDRGVIPHDAAAGLACPGPAWQPCQLPGGRREGRREIDCNI